MLDKHNCELIREIKSRIIAMMMERGTLESENNAMPSNLWQWALTNSDYMLGLEEKYYERLRLHTYHFTGDSHLNYWGDPADLRRIADEVEKDIPPGYIINELGGGIGYHYDDGRFISKDSLRFQKTINTLYRASILAELASGRPQFISSGPRRFICEIGAGYGGLLHHLSNFIPNATCVIVDLPEILLFSASYLSIHNPDKKLFLYDTDEIALINKAVFFDFILIPNYRLELLKDYRFDLVLNIASLQEMRTAQVKAYLDFIYKTCAGTFYSLNLDCYIKNKELDSLTELLKEKFDLTEISPPEEKGSLISRWRKAKVDTKYTVEREYLCKPRKEVS